MKKVLALVSVLVLLLSCVPAMAWENGVVVKVGIVGSTNEYWTVAMAEKMKGIRVSHYSDELLRESLKITPNASQKDFCNKEATAKPLFTKS